MNKFYKIHEELGQWDIEKIIDTLRRTVYHAGVRFDHWRGTVELKRIADGKPSEEWCDVSLNYDPDAVQPSRITNGDINLTTNPDVFTALDQQLFGGTGRRGRIVDGKGTASPAMPDCELATLVPAFKGTIIEEFHNFMQERFNSPIRMRCQNRTVNGVSQGLYWHKDDPVENRFHMPLWTNPGHVLLFTDKDFKWEAGFDPEEAKQPMDFVGHYVPADGRIYEMFTKDHMHAVASVGVGWYQPRWQQTRCHLSFWLAKD